MPSKRESSVLTDEDSQSIMGNPGGNTNDHMDEDQEEEVLYSFYLLIFFMQ
jgi:hypothetical protein